MIVIDYSQIAISTILSELPEGETLTLDLIRHMIINTIRSYKTKFSKEYGQLVIAVDSRNYWRKQAFRYYKANRKKDRAKSTLDWDSIYEALGAIKQELAEYFPYPVIEVNGAEADDVIATLVEWSQTHDLVVEGLSDEPEPRKLLIVSGDHDFQQLQKYKNVHQFIPRTQSMVVANNPKTILMEHVIRGDSGDGIPNFLSDDDVFVNDSKKQKSIFAESVSEWVNWSLQDIAKAGYTQLKESYDRALKKAKKNNTELPPEPFTEERLLKNLLRNAELVDLTYIPDELENEIVHNFEQQKTNLDRQKLSAYMIRFNLMSLYESIGEF